MSQNRLRLKDRVIIVTGGAQGIGRAYCLGMAEEGAKVVVADINLEAAEKTAADIRKNGKEAMATGTDISSQESNENMVMTTMEKYGRIDVLVNNAAVFERTNMVRAPFWELDLGEWDRLMAVNLKGTFLCCRAVFPIMKEQGAGKIINISSATFFAGVPFQSHYVASKAAIIGFSRSIAREVGDFNITVNCIAPGATQGYEVEEKEAYDKREVSLQRLVPLRCLKRIETVEDLVGTVIFLASSDSDFITGQTIVVDGGEVMN